MDEKWNDQSKIKKIRMNFQSLIMQVLKLRIISFLQLEDIFNKFKDNKWKSTISQRVYTQDVTVVYSAFEWII